MFRLAGIGGVVGLVAGVLLTVGTARAWPLVTGGMPIVAWWPNLVVIFELTMLGAILTTVGSLLVTARLPSRLREMYDPAVSDGKILVGVTLFAHHEPGRDPPRARRRRRARRQDRRLLGRNQRVCILFDRCTGTMRRAVPRRTPMKLWSKGLIFTVTALTVAWLTSIAFATSTPMENERGDDGCPRHRWMCATLRRPRRAPPCPACGRRAQAGCGRPGAGGREAADVRSRLQEHPGAQGHSRR